MKRYTVTPTPKKSVGQVVFDYTVVIVASAFIIAIIKKVFEFLYKPFYYWSLKPEELANLHMIQAIDKKKSRDARSVSFKKNLNDPMVQYRLRYIECPDNFPNQEENKEYLKWYQEWRAGNVEDPELRWAPEFYSVNSEGVISPMASSEFVSYLEMQLKVVSNQSKLLKTISKYYPELTPTIAGLTQNIEEIKNIKEEERLHNELYDKLVACGVSGGMTKYVEDMDPSQLRDAIACFKKCREFGYSDVASSVIFKVGLEPDSEMAHQIDTMATKAWVPEKLFLAVFTGEITMDEFKKFIDGILSYLSTYGLMSLFYKDSDGVTVYDLKVEECLRTAGTNKRTNQMESSLNKKVWEN